MSEQPSSRSGPDGVTGRIVTRIDTWASTTAEVVPGTHNTAGGIQAAVREFARQFNPDRRVAARLEAGELVRMHLARFAKPATPRPAWMPSPPVPGLPIVANDNLGPDEWRLIDTDGAVMSEGRLEGKQL